MAAIQQLIGEIKNLKPVPAVVHQLLDIIDRPDTSMGDVARVIQYDPAITASVLRACNSAYFGLRQPAESIKDAVSLLGMEQIVELVLLKSGAGLLKGDQGGYGLHEGAMWRYSVSSAIIARQIAHKLSLGNRGSIFTAALLKDMGKVVLNRFIQDGFDQISSLVARENISFMEAEKRVIGVDHAELGGMIAKMWKFSPRMVTIIRNHHLGDVSMVGDKEIAVVYLADCICMMMGIGVGADGLAYRFNDRAMEELGIASEDISGIIAEFASQIQAVDELLNTV